MGIYPAGVSDNIISLCNSDETIASALQKRPTSSTHAIWEELFPKPFVLKRLISRFTIKSDLYHGRGDPSKEDLDRAAQCGKFPYRPSDLFLKIFSDVLLCLERDPLADMCAPNLIGTSGVMPLSIISVIPDIMQHYYDCIVLAEQEVILATNYWQPSNSVDKISNSLRELSKRAGKRGQKNLPVKVMWDRGEISQAIDNHAMVNQEGREALKLPTLEEIPNLILEVINFHRPVMGTFHAKFLIVDRKVALINSNNIQDRPNLEMMVHLEGAVVESFYDIFLHSWYHKLTPMLPCLMQPPPVHNHQGRKANDFQFQEQNPYLSGIELVKASKAARAMLNLQKVDDEKLGRIREQAEKDRANQAFNPQARLQAVLGALSENRRGSFGSDTGVPSGQNGTTLGGAEGADQGVNGQPRQTTLKFSDVVMQAYEKRRKSFYGGSAARPTLSTVNSTNEPAMVSSTPPLASHTVGTQASANHQEETERAESTSAREHTLSDSREDFSSVTASHNVEYPESLNAAQTAPFLPALQLPNPSFDTPSGTPRATTPNAPDATQSSLTRNTQRLQVSPPTTGDRPLSPIISDRGSATHPGSAVSSEDPTRPFAHDDGSSRVDGLPVVSGPAGLGIQQPDSGNDTPALSNSMHSSAVTDQSSIGPETPPTSVLSQSQPRMYEKPTSPPKAGLNGQAASPALSMANRRSFMGGINVGRTRSKSGSIRSGVNGSALSGPPEAHTPRQRALSSVLNAGALSEAWSTVEDTDVLDEFNPHTLHKKHDPFPIAMVNRKPHGLPGHQDIRVPQDAAWLAGFRYAQRTVFIQTPTFNAKPIIAAAQDACRRGIIVTIYVDLGFNDKGESMPFQGGTNEEVVERMYKELNRTGHQKNLHVYWYTGKDQVRPLNAVKKQRNCHVKFMQVDDQIGIQGNGNQDTQSWYHSCEVNIMVDSAQIVGDWMAAIHRQQNTELYGRVDDDGIWRDKATGKTPAELEIWENEQKALREKELNGGSSPKRSSSRFSLKRTNSAKSSIRGSPSLPPSALREGSTATA